MQELACWPSPVASTPLCGTTPEPGWVQKWVNRVGDALSVSYLHPYVGESRAGKTWRQEKAILPQISNRVAPRHLSIQGLPCLPSHSSECPSGKWGHVVGKGYFPNGGYATAEPENENFEQGMDEVKGQQGCGTAFGSLLLKVIHSWFC